MRSQNKLHHFEALIISHSEILIMFLNNLNKIRTMDLLKKFAAHKVTSQLLVNHGDMQWHQLLVTSHLLVNFLKLMRWTVEVHGSNNLIFFKRQISFWQDTRNNVNADYTVSRVMLVSSLQTVLTFPCSSKK